ncbi:MAG: hypothetical protein DRP11_00090 [Candidatus Aenigmatarchaeota archaeon]|nr:MAG: hypothetical protein DRP11_00090 [Candidatus Aenigmarchaeota archaeon]
MGIRTGYIKATRSDKTSTFAGNLTVTGTTTLSGNVTCAGDLTIQGNLSFGDATTDTLTATGYAKFYSGAEFWDTTTVSGALQINNNQNLQFEGASGDSDGLTISCDSSGDATISVTAGQLTLSTSDNVISAAGEAITAESVEAKLIHQDNVYTSSGSIETGGIALLSGSAKLEMTLADPGAPGKMLVIVQKDAGTDGHTVTAATANAFKSASGQGTTLTFDAQNEVACMVSINETDWAVYYISGAALS